MLHRGPMDRLTTFTTHLPILSTCLLLLIQFQIFHALPTSAALSSSSDISQQANTQGASSISTAYAQQFPYSSYRPGLSLNSYRPYAYQNAGSISETFPAAAVNPNAHQNSVYSSQSATPPSQSKVGQLTAKQGDDYDDNVSKQQQYIDMIGIEGANNNEKKVGKGKEPRLLPLPSLSKGVEKGVTVPESEQKESHPNPSSEDVVAEEQRSVELSFPPPFAPELDPAYERREAGLGPISLLDQAGPFW